jgi:hypothetical protein
MADMAENQGGKTASTGALPPVAAAMQLSIDDASGRRQQKSEPTRLFGVPARRKGCIFHAASITWRSR